MLVTKSSLKVSHTIVSEFSSYSDLGRHFPTQKNNKCVSFLSRLWPACRSTAARYWRDVRITGSIGSI